MLASGEVDALMLEYNLIQTHRPALQHPLPRRQVLPVPGAHRGGDLAAGAGAARRQAQEASATSAPTGTPGRSATRSTRSPGCSRCAPARTPSSTNGRAPSGPASTTTSAGARARACRRSPGSRRSPTASTSTRMADFLAGNAKQVLRRLERRDGRGGRAAGVRTGRQAPRPAGRRPPGDGDPGDGAHPARGPRRRSGWPRTTSRRRSRCSSSGAAGCWAARAGWWTAWRNSTAPSWSVRSSVSSTWSATTSRPGCSSRRPADANRSWSSGSPAPGLARAHRRARTGRQAEAARGGHPATPTRPSTGTSCAGPRTSALDPAPSPTSRSTSAWSRPRCGSSATTSRTWAPPTRSDPWWCSRTACRNARTIAGSRSREWPDRTISLPWRRCSAAGSRAC